MPVDSQHKLYVKRRPQWQRVADFAEGSDRVKLLGTKYLPKPDGMKPKQYSAYRTRAMLFPATERTIKGLAGFVIRRDPQQKVPPKLEELLKHVGNAEETWAEVYTSTLEKMIGVGRRGELVDAPARDNGEPFVSIYEAEAMTDHLERWVDGRKIPVRINLKETRERTVEDDPFKKKEEDVYRVLMLGTPPESPSEALRDQTDADFENPVYWQEIWEKSDKTITSPTSGRWVRTEIVVPTKKGGDTWNRIPFMFFNPESTQATPSKPPLLDQVDVNHSHYLNSADLEHGLFYTSIPQAWAAGFKFQGEVHIGAGVWVSPEPQASAGYLEFTGEGLGALMKSKESKERLMAVLGSRLLEGQKKAAEAAETVKLKQAGEKSVLARISETCSLGHLQVLLWLAEWIAQPTEGIEFELNTDFDLGEISHEKLIALVGAVQSGLMSFDTMHYNLKKGEMYPDGRTLEDEQRLIDAGLPGAAAVAAKAAAGGPNPGDDEGGNE